MSKILGCALYIGARYLPENTVLKNAKSDSRAFCGPKAGKSPYFTHPNFSAAKLEKKVHKLLNPLPVQFKSLLPGQEGCVFFQWAFKCT
jgi:hypothetical protein